MSRPVLVVMSVLAGAQILTGGAALGEYIGAQLAGLLILSVAALQGGMQFWLQNQVTPNSAVVVRRDAAGTTVVGPAAKTTNDGIATNAVVGEPVEVTLTRP